MSGEQRPDLCPSVIAPALDRWDAGGAPWQVSVAYSKPRKQGANVLFRGVASDGRRSVAIKSHADPSQNNLQFDALHRLHRATGQVAEPCFLDPELGYLVMAWVEGPTLLDAMPTPGRHAALDRAGRWLANFHARTVEPAPRADPLTAWHRLQPDADPDVVARLADWRAGLSSTKGPCAQLHTDLQLHNLIDTGDTLVAIDPAYPAVGHVAWDIARFVIGLTLFRRRAAGGAGPWPGTAAEDRAVFLAGYGGIPEDQAALYAYVHAFVLARQWSRAMARERPGRNWRLPILQRMMYRRGLLGPNG